MKKVILFLTVFSLVFLFTSCDLTTLFGEEQDSGNLEGTIRNAVTNNPISGVEITLHSSHHTETKNSDTDGKYTFSETPIGSYSISFQKTGYLEADGVVEIKKDETEIYPQILYLSTDHSGDGTYQGKVQDALDGTGISGVTMKLRSGLNNTTGTIINTYTTDSSGDFSFTKTYGYYTLELIKTDYTTTSYNITVVGNDTITQDLTMTPILAAGETRIILTWGEIPSDLDSHLVKVKNGTVEYHVYYDDQTSSEAELDHDDTTSYGPETITITNIDDDADYYYYIRDYTNHGDTTDSNELANSSAKVELYYEGNYKVYNVPSGGATIWQVFKISSGTLIRQDIMTYDEPYPTD
jgi:hypothetical protein